MGAAQIIDAYAFSGAGRPMAALGVGGVGGDAATVIRWLSDPIVLQAALFLLGASLTVVGYQTARCQSVRASSTYMILATAAFRAIPDRSSGGSESARALPPFLPPRLPRMRAAALRAASSLFTGSAPAGGSGGTSWSVARSTRDLASWFTSEGALGFLERLRMAVA